MRHRVPSHFTSGVYSVSERKQQSQHCTCLHPQLKVDFTWSVRPVAQCYPLDSSISVSYMVMVKKQKKKVKWSRYRPDVTQRVGRGIALLFHDRGTRRGWVVSSTPQLHFTPGKDPVPILQEAGWAPGLVWTGGKSRPHWDSIPGRAACSSVTIPTELPGPLLIIVMSLLIVVFLVPARMNVVSSCFLCVREKGLKEVTSGICAAG